MPKTVVAIFDDRSNAEKAAYEIADQGLKTDDISIVAKESNGDTEDPQTNNFTMSSEGGATGRGVNDNISDGTVGGGVLGGLAGLLIGAGSMMIPGLGIVAAAGPITGLISGAITGGIVGGLVDLGIPENRSRQYETDVKAGKILFSMKTDENNIDTVAGILRENNAISVDSY